MHEKRQRDRSADQWFGDDQLLSDANYQDPMAFIGTNQEGREAGGSHSRVHEKKNFADMAYKEETKNSCSRHRGSPISGTIGSLMYARLAPVFVPGIELNSPHACQPCTVPLRYTSDPFSPLLPGRCNYFESHGLS